MTDTRAGLHELQVVDLGLGMPAGLVTKFLREVGARITRVEPPAGDPFYGVYPAYKVWRQGLDIDAGTDSTKIAQSGWSSRNWAAACSVSSTG